MNIVITNPPTFNKKRFIREGRCTQEMGVWATLWPPISLAMIGAVLEQAGHQVCLLDCPAMNLDISGLLTELGRIQPEMVLWSTGTPSIENDLGLAALIKKLLPFVKTGVFGTHVTALASECLQANPPLDFIIRGEPELTIRDLAACLGQDGDLAKVAGLTYREGQDGRAGQKAIRENSKRGLVDPLDSLPQPAWHLLDLKAYRLPLTGRPFLILAPMRGCPFNCTFCTAKTYYGAKVRKRSIAMIIEEIEANISKYQVRDFFIWADTFTADPNYIRSFCEEIIKRELPIQWTCNSRVDTINPGLLKLMAKAGCWMISYGLESAHQQVLDTVKKGTTVEQGIQAVQWSKEAGLKVVGHFVLGLPGDTEESLRKTIGLAKKLPLDVVQFYTAAPFPGSRLYEQAKEQGWLLQDDFSLFRQNQAVLELPGLSAQIVNKWRARAYLSFYFRPVMGWRSMKLLDRQKVNNLCLNVKNYLTWMVCR